MSASSPLPTSSRTAVLAVLLTAAVAACGGPPAAARQARAHIEAGDLRGAEQAIDQGLAQHPRDGTLWTLRIRVHALRGDNARAVAAWREWREVRGTPDGGAARGMAILTLWNATRADAADARVAAIEAAWALDDDRLAEPVARLLDDDDEVVRATAAAALLRSHPDAPTVLTDALRSPEPRARRIAVVALGEKVGAPARADLLAALADRHPSVRAAAASALGRIKDPADVPRLVRAASDADGGVRAAALRALADLRARAGVDVARAALSDTYLGARLAAIELLDAALADGARAELAKVAAGADAFAALRAGVVLARRGDRAPGSAALRAAVASKEWTVRAAAANAAVSIAGKRDAATWLAPLAADAELSVRLAAARAYIQADRKADAVLVLAAALASTDEAARLQAVIDLQRLSDQRATAAWDALLASPAVAIREQTVTALRAGGPLADGLVAALADPSWRVRVAAAWTILARS